MTKKKKEYIPVFDNNASAPSAWHKKLSELEDEHRKINNKMAEIFENISNRQQDRNQLLKSKKIHKIGKHGAIGWETQDGSICGECFKPIRENEKKV